MKFNLTDLQAAQQKGPPDGSGGPEGRDGGRLTSSRGRSGLGVGDPAVVCAFLEFLVGHGDARDRFIEVSAAALNRSAPGFRVLEGRHACHAGAAGVSGHVNPFRIDKVVLLDQQGGGEGSGVPKSERLLVSRILGRDIDELVFVQDRNPCRRTAHLALRPADENHDPVARLRSEVGGQSDMESLLSALQLHGVIR